MVKERKIISLLLITVLGLGIIYWLSQKQPGPNSLDGSSTNLRSRSASSSTSSSRINSLQPKKSQKYQDQILNLLKTWKERDKEATLLIEGVIQLLNSPQPELYKIKAVENLSNCYQEAEPAENYSSVQLTENYQQIQNLIVEWKNYETQQVQNLKKDWFVSCRWLTDKEIDWALNQLPVNPKYKILPAYQFHYVIEIGSEDLGFPQLLNDLADEQPELIFLPVNNPDFHWSLLVYETSTKSFWHYDTLSGANDYYIKPLIKDLIIQFWQINETEFDQMQENEYLKTNYKIKQGNGHDCGVAVIEITKRIQGLGNCFGGNDKQRFDFGKARKQWKKKLENE